MRGVFELGFYQFRTANHKDDYIRAKIKFSTHFSQISQSSVSLISLIGFETKP
jgi:hypothetical protein